MADALDIRAPDGSTRRVELDRARLTVGRSRDNDVAFPDDSSLSRRHFELEHDGESWYVEDLGSKNGTRVNGVPIGVRRRLRAGDRIHAGRLAAVLAVDGARPELEVEFYNEPSAGETESRTVLTSLEGVLGSEPAMTMLRPGPGAPQTFHPAAVRALIRAGRELAGRRPLDELFPLILDLSIEAVDAERGVILTLETEELRTRASRGDGFRISTSVRDRVLEEKASILVRDVSQDQAFRDQHSLFEQNVSSFMAVPLQTDRQVIGLVYVDSRSLVRAFGQEDLNLLTVLANVAAIRIEHQRLQEIEERERLLARDVDAAADIQRRLLPASPPTLPGIDLAGHNAACRTVGGDYFDYLPYDAGRVGLVLADVAGKGLPAALLMTNLQAMVRVLAEEIGDIGTLVGRLDRFVAARTPRNRFISLAFCLIDRGAGTLQCCNAGHNPPIVMRAGGEVEELPAGGTVLGILPEIGYETCTVPFRTGDVLLLYSDGITESADPAGEEYGAARLIELLRVRRGDAASTIVDEVLEAVTAWTGGAPAADDVTVLVARASE